MREISTNLQISLQKDVTNLVKIYTLTLKDNSVLGFTDSDAEITFGGVIYKPNIQSEKLLKSLEGKDRVEIFGVIDSELINEQNIKSGKFLDAHIEIAAIDLNNLSEGKIVLNSGFIESISYDNSSYIFNIKPYSEKLKRVITQNYSKKCRADFGDSKCGINLENYKSNGSVTEIIDEKSFKVSALGQENFYYNYGIISFTNGANNGLKFNIKSYKDDIIKLFLSPNSAIEIGDNFEIFTGCDKSFNCCIEKFDNAENFRGEPHIPGNDKLFRGF